MLKLRIKRTASVVCEPGSVVLVTAEQAARLADIAEPYTGEGEAAKVEKATEPAKKTAKAKK